MGDRQRFEVFTDFIRETWPGVKTVADVAGGHGVLAFHLRAAGFEPTIIDTRDAHLPRRLKKALRKQALGSDLPETIAKIVSRVEDVDLDVFDLVVALHPDEATEPAVRTALALGKDFAVVPCCVFPLDGVKRSQEAWRDYLAGLDAGIRRTMLPMTGRSEVLFRKGADLRAAAG